MAELKDFPGKSRLAVLDQLVPRMYDDHQGPLVTDAGAKAALSMEECLRVEAHWVETADAERPWRADVGDKHWELHLNDFPAEPMYTLFIDGKRVGDFDDWPLSWSR